MSIWSSVTTSESVRGSDICRVGHSGGPTGGEPDVGIDVAIAPSWTDRIRLTVDADAGPQHICVALEPDAARELIRQLEAALAEVQRRREEPAS